MTGHPHQNYSRCVFSDGVHRPSAVGGDGQLRLAHAGAKSQKNVSKYPSHSHEFWYYIWKSRKTHPHSHNIAAAKKTPSQGNSLSNPSSTFYKAPKHGPVLQRNPRDRGNSWLCHHHRMPSSPSQTPEQENDGHRLQGKSERCLLSLSCGEQNYLYVYMCVYCTHINICPVNWIHILHII